MRHRATKWLRTSAIVAAVAVLLAAPSTAHAAPSGHPASSITWRANTLRQVYVPPSGEYSYAPSVVERGDTQWVWTCHNSESRVIRDHVFLEKFVRGRLVEDRSVLQATEGAWDSFHTCDPSVVTGRFGYGGETYGWAMFYLGNDLDASAHNQIGVAFAKSPEGPWVKYPDPIVPFAVTTQWGVGQPSAVSTDPASGKVTLFYTRGDTSTRAYWRSLDFGDMAHPVIGDAHLVPITGLRGTTGNADYLNNYDIAYDRGRDAFVAAREQHPYPTDNPWWIGDTTDVDTISASDLLSGTGTWHPLNSIGPSLTGIARNHNAGLVRTATGALPDSQHATVVFTSSCAGPTCDSLYSYDLWQVTGDLR